MATCPRLLLLVAVSVAVGLSDAISVSRFGNPGNMLGVLPGNLPDVPGVFPPLAIGQLETINLLKMCCNVTLDSPATLGEEPTIMLLPGAKGNVPIMAIDPTTKSRYIVTVFYNPLTPGTCTGPFYKYATNGPVTARAVAALGYRAVLPGFCTSGDGKDLIGLLVQGFPDPQGTDTKIGTQFECAKRIASGV